MKKIYRITLGYTLVFSSVPLFTGAQDFIKNGEVSGSMQFDGQYYVKDPRMGITDSSLDGRLTRMNAFTQVDYSYKDFTAGLRFEAYLPPLVGYDMQYQGAGVPYWYVNYRNDFLEITAGNFYEQFGYGMSLRTWQEWTLGYDNSLRGLRVKVTPVNGIVIKGVWGYQRNYWEPFTGDNRGIIKGADMDIFLNDLLNRMKNSKIKIGFGGSLVSDYQRGKTTDVTIDTIIYTFKLPENVAVYSTRVNLNIGGFGFFTEYAHKYNDPTALNHYIYKPGNGLFTSISWSQKNFGITGSLKIIDNMSYKSNRNVMTNQLSINYLPALNKQHTYALSSMYPYATQPNGEYGFSGSVNYTIPKHTKLGGQSGISFWLNFTRITSLSKDSLSGTTIGEPGTLGYKTNFFTPGNEVYYQDFNLEVTKKFSKQWKGIFTYLNQIYNKDVIEGHLNEYGLVYANIGIADITWNITKKHSLRGELQGLWTKQDKGNWAAGLLEFTIAPKWFFSVQDQWNYGNSDKSLQLHYFLFNAGFIYNTSRISLSYGRQREGILCVGGVCRYVPAASGITLTLTSSF